LVLVSVLGSFSVSVLVLDCLYLLLSRFFLIPRRVCEDVAEHVGGRCLLQPGPQPAGPGHGTTCVMVLFSIFPLSFFFFLRCLYFLLEIS
jgi:hypothetical protein